MNRFLKTLMLWLLVAALPVQGWAAAGKVSCGTVNQIAAVSIEAIHHYHHPEFSSEQHAQHSMQPVQFMHTADAGVVADMTLQQDIVQQHEPVAGLDSPHASSYCSACSVCSTSPAAPAATLNWSPVYAAVAAKPVAPAASFAGFIPPGLERPPRLISA